MGICLEYKHASYMYVYSLRMISLQLRKLSRNSPCRNFSSTLVAGHTCCHRKDGYDRRVRDPVRSLNRTVPYRSEERRNGHQFSIRKGGKHVGPVYCTAGMF